MNPNGESAQRRRCGRQDRHLRPGPERNYPVCRFLVEQAIDSISLNSRRRRADPPGDRSLEQEDGVAAKLS